MMIPELVKAKLQLGQRRRARASFLGLEPVKAEGFQEEDCTDSFKQWVSRHWFDIVGSRCMKHYEAGTRVEKPRSREGCLAYAVKSYMSKAEVMPTLESKPGRFWGLIGRDKAKMAGLSRSN